jgi:hypothetical protein
MSGRATREWVASIMPTNAWTEVARRVRYFPLDQEQPDWEGVPGAPITLAQAVELEKSGIIFRALRYRPADLAVVVLRRREPPQPKLKTSGSQSTLTEWNDHKAARLRKLWLEMGDGGPVHTTAQIAEILDVPLEAVRSKVARLALPARGPSPRRERMAA